MNTYFEDRPVTKPQEPEIEIHGMPVIEPPPEIVPEQQPIPDPSSEPKPGPEPEQSTSSGE
jgi:hypothetical protein